MAKKKAKHALDLSGARKASFPKLVSPMLATLVDQPIEESGWVYEVKWDGYRAIALCHNGKINLLSRNNKSFNEKFYPIANTLKTMDLDAVVDGEITVLKNTGISSFGSL